MKMPPCHRYPSVDGILASLRLQPQRMICTRHKDSTESKDLSSPVSPGGCSNIRAACYRSCVLRHRMVKQYCCPCVLRRLHPELDISFARPNSRLLDTFAFNNLRHYLLHTALSQEPDASLVISSCRNHSAQHPASNAHVGRLMTCPFQIRFEAVVWGSNPDDVLDHPFLHQGASFVW